MHAWEVFTETFHNFSGKTEACRKTDTLMKHYSNQLRPVIGSYNIVLRLGRLFTVQICSTQLDRYNLLYV